MKQTKNIENNKMSPHEYWLFFKDKSKKVVRVYTRNRLRFHNKVKNLKPEDFKYGVKIKVSYGKHEDNFGKMVEFTNEGKYDNKKDLDLAVKSFLED